MKRNIYIFQNILKYKSLKYIVIIVQFQ